MSTSTFDAVVLGGGGMGSAAAYHLTRTGQRVLLSNSLRSTPEGRSYGFFALSVIRMTIRPTSPWQEPWQPMWAEVEEEAGEQLHVQTGGLISPPGEPGLENTFASVQRPEFARKPDARRARTSSSHSLASSDGWKSSPTIRCWAPPGVEGAHSACKKTRSDHPGSYTRDEGAVSRDAVK
jgi:glycine/D-amino acid oxidase-like deaminating enzyme